MNVFEATFRLSPTGFAHLDLEGRVLLANPALEKMLGYASGLDSLSLFEISHPDQVAAERELFADLVAGRIATYEIEKRFLSDAGEPIWARSTASLVQVPSAPTPFVLLAVTDVTHYRTLESDLRAELASYESLWQTSTTAIAILRANGDVVRAYPGFTRLFGYSEEEAVGRNIEDLIGPDDRRAEISSNLDSAVAGNPINIESVRRTKDGTLLDVSILGRSFQRTAGELGIFVLYRDISDRKEAEALIQRLSTTDELTGLWNRRGFYTLAEQEVRRAAREQVGLILLFADLDSFKSVNDEFGHAEGDRALTEIARRLRDSCRGSDTIARMGGDEFVVLAAGNEEGEQILVDRIRRSLDTLNARGTLAYPLSMSIGSVFFRPGSDGFNFDEMISRADRRMYEEKQRSPVGS